MIMRLFVPLMVLFALALMFGCSDDECPTCPQPAQKAVAWGYTSTNDTDNELFFMSFVFGLDGKLVAVDSVKYEGNKTELREGLSELGTAVYAMYEEIPTTYDSGDTVEIKYFLPSGSGTARVKLLDSEFDEPTVLSHSTSYPYDTVAVNEGITIAWRSVAVADFYSVNWSYYYDSSGTRVERFESYFTTDNDLVILAGTLSFNGRIGLNIYAITGPRPDIEIGNVSGSVINGNVSSIAADWVDIYVGTGVYKATARSEPETPREMIESYMNILSR